MGAEKEQLHVVFICDENYVMPTIVAMESLLMSKKAETEYFVHVLGCEVSENSQKLFTEMACGGFRVEVLDLTQSDMLKDCAIENLHVSTAALYKFNIAKLFSDYDKVLYLDGDILVQKDLTGLYQTDISGVYAAVVKDYKPMTYRPPQVEKLGIRHSAYFNSGVMLLNLKKFREDGLAEKLLDYRIHGINYFMDQDALNVVFQEKVIYLSLLDNVMSSVMGYFKFSDIKDYYELQELTSKEEIYQEATIVHLCTKFKPWDYSNVPFADQWMFYYSKSPYSEPLDRKRLDEKNRAKVFSELGQKMTPRIWNIRAEVILSLTSFPARIGFVPKVIESLQQQTVKADRIMLWLAESQFPGKEKDLPDRLIEQMKDGVEIHWCEDLRPHKKYFYTMQAFPDSIVITVDDDIYYDSKLVEQLLDSYVKYPYAVSAMRAHQITFTQDGEIAPYAKWHREYRHIGIPSMALCATGVGGVLYPPRCMDKSLFDQEQIQELCIDADDLWLKVMQVLAYTPVVVAALPKKLNFIEDSQDDALWKSNDTGGSNDRYLANILQCYDRHFSESDTVTERIRVSCAHVKELPVGENTAAIKAELKKAKGEIRNIQDSASYRIGRFITFIPRKIRGGIRCYREHGWDYTLQRVLVHLGVKEDPYR